MQIKFVREGDGITSFYFVFIRRIVWLRPIFSHARGHSPLHISHGARGPSCRFDRLTKLPSDDICRSKFSPSSKMPWQEPGIDNGKKIRAEHSHEKKCIYDHGLLLCCGWLQDAHFDRIQDILVEVILWIRLEDNVLL